MKMQNSKKGTFLQILGLILCIFPPVLATLEHFPIWAARGGEVMVSALTLILLFLCVIPLNRHIFTYLKSPSAWAVWLCVYIIFSLVSKIVDDVVAIALVAFPFNLLGAFCFRLAKRYKVKDKSDL